MFKNLMSDEVWEQKNGRKLDLLDGGKTADNAKNWSKCVKTVKIAVLFFINAS